MMCKWKVLYEGYWISTIIDERDLPHAALRDAYARNHPGLDPAHLSFAVVPGSEMSVPT